MGARIAHHASLDARFSVTPITRSTIDARVDASRCVVIDFSSHDGALRALKIAQNQRCALLIGTTGLPEGTLRALREASDRVAVLVTPNTSPGVAAVADAGARLARALGPHYTCAITETHHVHKKDAPSGTALRLAQALRDAGVDCPDDRIHAVREGEVIGTHTITLTGPGEVIELTHRATTRDLFALGALRAGAWLAQQPPGWYTMADSLRAGP